MELHVAVLVVVVLVLVVMMAVMGRRYRHESGQWKQAEQKLRENELQSRELFEASQRQTQELALLEQVRTTTIARELDMQNLIRTVVDAIAQTFGYEKVSLYLIQHNMFVVEYQTGYEKIEEKIPIDQGLMGRAITAGQPVLLDDIRTDPAFSEMRTDIVSEVCIPLFDHKRAVGALNVASSHGKKLSEADLALMSALGDHINVAIERAQLHAAVRESEHRYRSVVDNVKEVIFQTDTAGRWLFLNPAWTDITGFSIEESLHREILDYVHKEDREQHRSFFSSLVSDDQESRRYEMRCVKRDGSTFWVEVNVRTMRDPEGAVIGTFGTLDDITDRKLLEKERFRLSKLEIIAPLAGGLAHDFNNLLTGILGNITFAKMFVPPDAEERLMISIKRAEDATMQAKNLTQQLLAFSKEGTLVTHPASIQELIRESAEFVLHGSNVRCEFTIPETLWPADIDIGQISQVIQNLVLNAQQAMPDGGVITVRAENIRIDQKMPVALPHGSYVKLTVSDQGDGVPDEIRDKIFDPYFTTKPTGSGLGLATSYSIIENHRGLMRLDSKAGEGAIFTIYLPASPDEEVQIKPEEEPEYRPGQGNILVMENDDIVRGMVAGILTHCGYTVTVTRDGAEAVGRYADAREAGESFDAVLMDMTVPGGMGGKEAGERILARDPQAKVIVSSGYPDDPVLVDFRAYGFAGVVLKPYRAQELSAVLHEVITNGYADFSHRSDKT